MLVFALLMTLTVGVAFAGNGNGNGKHFNDINNHWGMQSILRMQELGILNGYEDGTFDPDGILTQAELAVILDRLKTLKQNDNQQALDNEDIDEDQNVKNDPGWAKKAIANGYKNNYLNLKRFHSEVQCSRLTGAIALAKVLGLEPVIDFSVNPFKDSQLMISDTDYGYLLALYEAGYIKGYPDGNFNPNGFLTRAQMAKIMDDIMDDGDIDSEDTTPPVWATGSAITASSITANSLILHWTGASDNTQLLGYKVIYDILNTVDTPKVKYAALNKTTQISGLLAETEYNFKLEARDPAGNWSTSGPSIVVKTLKEVDISNPYWTSGAALTVSPSAITSTSITLKWAAAVDNVGVTEYRAYQDNVQIITLPAIVTETAITGLTLNQAYTFKVVAFDAAGNNSAGLSAYYKPN